ncbi:Gamma-tubulin complex component 3 [Terramyces sp. JEL0728]|nr:Gamma-tubulin complex component 3 [Terramyces sp. JEL0728]
MLGNERKTSNDNSNDGSLLVSKALFRVVLRYMTKNGKESPRLSNVYEYCVRILGSRLQPTIMKDDGHLLTLIQKKYSETESFQRFDTLNNKLKDMKSIQRSWEVVYFLYSISDQQQSAFNNVSMIKMSKEFEPQERNTSSNPKSPPVPTQPPKDHTASVYSSYYLPPLSERDGNVYLSESEIVKELLFVFQAIDGKYIRFVPIMKKYVLDERVVLPSPTISLIYKLTVLGELTKGINDQLLDLQKLSLMSIFQQSLLSSVQDEMQDFLKYPPLTDSFVQGGISLKRLFVWTNGPLIRIRLLNQILDTCESKKGCQILTMVHKLVFHGDSTIQDYVKKMMLMKWIYEGELDDPFGEFFVASDLNADGDNLWKSRYIFKKDRLPAFLSETLAMKAFLIGKSLNFIRYSCQDANFGQAHILSKQNLMYGDLKKLEHSIDSSYQSITQYLMNLLFSKYDLRTKFEELKAYMLLGQGDFVQYLMDNLKNSLSNSAATIYRHNLTGTLESAMRYSNPNFESAGLNKRLDIRLLEVHGGEKGWDIFALDYTIDHPLNTIFTPQLMHIYHKLFIFLWKLKRVDHLLTSTWRNQMKSGNPKVVQIIHKSNLVRSEMIHFINQLQNYIQFEVIECSWNELMEKFESDKCDLNCIIDSHLHFLQLVLQKCFVSNNELHHQLMKLFDIILDYGNFQEKLVNSLKKDAGILEQVTSDLAGHITLFKVYLY